MKARPSNTRSAISNMPHVLDGLDGRSAKARRFRDLLHSIAANFGGVEALTMAELSQARQAAALMHRSDQLQVAVVQGGDANELTLLSDQVRRILADLHNSVNSRDTIAA
jgi:hypothetical protein